MNSCVGTKVLEGNVQKSLKYLSTAVIWKYLIGSKYGSCLAIFERLNMFKMFELFMRVTDSKGESLLMIRM